MVKINKSIHHFSFGESDLGISRTLSLNQVSCIHDKELNKQLELRHCANNVRGKKTRVNQKLIDQSMI